MKKSFSLITSMLVILSLIVISCNNRNKEAEEQVKIENTLISVGLVKDTLGYDLEELRKAYLILNEAIDEIGYPNAGYDLWINQSEDSEIRFLNIGYWPDQEVYDKIHKDQRYIDAGNAQPGQWDGYVVVDYNRFKKFITH